MKNDFYSKLGLIVVSSIQDSSDSQTDKKKHNKMKGDLSNIARVFITGGRSLVKTDYFKITPGRDSFIIASISGEHGLLIDKSNVQLIIDWVKHAPKPLTLAAWKITYGK